MCKGDVTPTKKTVCPHCKKPFNTVSKNTMLNEILKIVGARTQELYYSSPSREQVEDIYNWIKEQQPKKPKKPVVRKIREGEDGT